MKVLVTAGPTREAIDPVRFVSNRSSGKMGYAVAEAALAAGHEVRLVSGPVGLEASGGIEVVRATTAEDMLRAVEENVGWCDLLVMAAAVADWRPKHPASRKLKKADGPPRIEWEATPDILRTIGPRKKKFQVFCGFAAETDGVEREAKRKMREKKLDAIAANDVSDPEIGFESERNEIRVFLADGGDRKRSRTTKRECAEWLVGLLEAIVEKKKSENT